MNFQRSTRIMKGMVIPFITRRCYDPAMNSSLGIHGMGILLAVVACLTLFITLLIFVKRKPSAWAVSGLLFVVLFYISIMISLQSNN
jgi:uncharacterized membrane protein